MARKHRGVYERSPGVWCIEWFDEFGKRQRKTIGKKSDAIRAVEFLRTKVRLNRIAPELVAEPQAPKTLDEVMQFCYDCKRLKEGVRKLHRTYRRTWNKAFPGYRLSQITPELIEKWVAKRQSTKTQRGQYPAVATINRDLSYLKMVFNQACKRGWCLKNPVKLVEMFREFNEDDHFFTPEQMTRILRRQPNEFVSSVIEIAVETGLRQSEQFGLMRADLNLDLGQVRLRDPKSRKKEWVELSTRAVELFELVLERYGKDSEWVFPSQHSRHRGRPIDGVYFSRKYFLPTLQELELPGRWHTLRHTFASWLRLAGVDLLTIQELLRHSSESTTKRYAHIRNEDRKEAVNKLRLVSPRR